jgi:hypothetical protein
MLSAATIARTVTAVLTAKVERLRLMPVPSACTNALVGVLIALVTF